MYHFILGNVMFAVSGLSWIVDPVAFSLSSSWGGFERIFATLTSFFALFYFSSALIWLRRLFKYSKIQ